MCRSAWIQDYPRGSSLIVAARMGVHIVPEISQLPC